MKYFKGRYSPRIIGNLNKIIHLRYLLDAYKNKILFLQSCLDNNLALGYIVQWIRKIKCSNSINVITCIFKGQNFFLFGLNRVCEVSFIL